MYKLWRKSSIGQLPQVYWHSFEGQNQLPTKEKVLFGCLEPMKPQYNPKICNERFNCRTCGGGNSKAMHGYIPKRKRDDVQDGQLKEEVYHQ